MSNEALTLTYLNEDDRAYGLAGMAISLAALDALDRVSSIWLDAEGPMVDFSNEFYFAASPAISPKAAWETLVRNYYVTSTMVISNVMARSLVRQGRREVPADILGRVRDEILAEGADSCSLETDEADAVYTRSLRTAGRIFGNPRLHPAIEQFARVISRRRRLSGMEVADELRLLQLI